MRKSGITLIALVITVIVLLILTGITINLTIGQDGIIKRAEEAGRNYSNSEDYERNELAQLINKTDNIIANIASGNVGADAATIDINSLEAGDYIKYDSGDNGVIMCRVLYPATSQYGLQIISDKNVKDVTLGGSTWASGKTSYNNLIVNLNDYAEAYINTEYSQDARSVGSLPTVDENGNFTQKDKGSTTKVSISSSFTLPNGWTSRSSGCYNSDTNYDDDITQMVKAGILTTEKNYFLASRSVSKGTNNNLFSVRAIYPTSNGSVSRTLVM